MNTPTIKPSDIDTSEHFWDAFGQMETETSARWVERYCQQNGDSWAPFSREDLDAFYRNARDKHQGRFRVRNDHFSFNGLIASPAICDRTGGVIRGVWIVTTPDGLLQVTDDFVQRCYRSSPRKGSAAAVGA